jgi:hypothetical protein
VLVHPKLEIPAPTLVTSSNINFVLEKKKMDGLQKVIHSPSLFASQIDNVKLGSFIHIWYQCRSLANPRSVCVCVYVCVSLSSSLRTFSWTPEASESRLLLMGCLLLLSYGLHACCYGSIWESAGRGARTTCSIGGDGDQEDFKSYRSLEEELNIIRNLMCMLIPVCRSPSAAMIPAGADK